MITLCRFDPGCGDVKKAGMSVPTFDMSVDMLRSYISKDAGVVKALGIDGESFQVGTLTGEDVFCAFRGMESLKMAGVKEDGVVWVHF